MENQNIPSSIPPSSQPQNNKLGEAEATPQVMISPGKERTQTRWLVRHPYCRLWFRWTQEIKKASVLNSGSRSHLNYWQ